LLTVGPVGWVFDVGHFAQIFFLPFP
jgi:hypothetical protein